MLTLFTTSSIQNIGPNERNSQNGNVDSISTDSLYSLGKLFRFNNCAKTKEEGNVSSALAAVIFLRVGPGHCPAQGASPRRAQTQWQLPTTGRKHMCRIRKTKSKLLTITVGLIKQNLQCNTQFVLSILTNSSHIKLEKEGQKTTRICETMMENNKCQEQASCLPWLIQWDIGFG